MVFGEVQFYDSPLFAWTRGPDTSVQDPPSLGCQASENPALQGRGCDDRFIIECIRWSVPMYCVCRTHKAVLTRPCGTWTVAHKHLLTDLRVTVFTLKTLCLVSRTLVNLLVEGKEWSVC